MGGETLVRDLKGRLEDPSSAHKHPLVLGMTHTSVTLDEERQVLQVFQPDNLAESMSSRFSERPHLKRQGREQSRNAANINLCPLYPYMHICT